jgi:hypothetical protein
MAIPTSKPLAMSTVQTEYGGSNPINLSEYYSLGNAPASGEITLWADFNGTSNEVTVTSVSQKWNWYGNYNYTYEDTSQSADMIDAATSIRPSSSGYTLYSYIDGGEPWLGKTITAYSNLRIETKVFARQDSDGNPFTPPYEFALAASNVSYWAEDLTGATVASLGNDDHAIGLGTGTRTETRVAIDNADITGAMSDAQIKTWLSAGCPLQHTYYSDSSVDGSAVASVNAADVYFVRILADSITYIP